MVTSDTHLDLRYLLNLRRSSTNATMKPMDKPANRRARAPRIAMGA